MAILPTDPKIPYHPAPIRKHLELQCSCVGLAESNQKSLVLDHSSRFIHAGPNPNQAAGPPELPSIKSARAAVNRAKILTSCALDWLNGA